MMPSVPQLIAQGFAYLLFIGMVGYLSASPAYQHADPDKAVISLVISHPTQRVGECRKMTQEELAEIAKNMRQPTECPRGRHDLYIELLFDGELLFSGSAPPTGLWGDGPASVYHKFSARPGEGTLEIRMRDSGRESGFDYEREARVELLAQRNFVVGYTALRGFSFNGDRVQQ